MLVAQVGPATIVADAPFESVSEIGHRWSRGGGAVRKVKQSSIENEIARALDCTACTL
jgi:hypothetical protein